MVLGHFCFAAMSAPAAPIYDEAQVPAYVLPDVLRTPAGQTITTTHDWETLARPALLDAFSTHFYGHTPPTPDLRVTTSDTTTHEILNNKALLRQTRLHFHHANHTASIDVVLVLPATASAARPAPVLIGLNFWGNHTLSPDPAFRESAPAPGMEPKERGFNARRWPLEFLVAQGYAVVTAFRGEIAPDHPDHYHQGVLSLFPENTGDSRMGAIGAWAWTLSRLADHAATLPELDAARLNVFGHSRLGKAALWAAAQDQRFIRVFANNTGSVGAALNRREFGETVALITRGYPYWFAPRLATYGDGVNQLPVDQHQLLALIAPRPLHLGAAQKDLWADPRGELLALRAAAPAYALYGITTDLPDQLPAPDAQPIGTTLRLHHREGGHDLLASDWQAYLSSTVTTHP